MSCWYPSNTQEAWFPQLRVNRLMEEAKKATSKLEKSESVTAKPRRRSTKVVAESEE